MKWWIAAICCSSLTIYGANKATESPPPPAYDADLYRRDAQVFSFHAAFLYWRVQEGALDFALKMKEDAWGPTPSYAQGNYKTATFNGAPGFRIGWSFFRAPRHWEVWMQYTRLSAEGSNSAHKPGPANQFLTGTWPQALPNPLSSARSHIHLNYNVADLLVDRYFNPNPHLRVRFLGGGSVAWMNQDWQVRYRDTAANLTQIHNQWKYVAGGLKIGTMVDWFWDFQNIYITASGSGGVFMGSYHNKSRQTTSTPTIPGSDNPAVPIRNAEYQDIRPAFTVQAAVGPSWQKNFSCSRVEVFVGYEATIWMNVHEVYRSTAASPSQAKETWINTSMMALQGLTARATVDF